MSHNHDHLRKPTTHPESRPIHACKCERDRAPPFSSATASRPYTRMKPRRDLRDQYFHKMDVAKIIDMVQEYKCLWDQRDARYHARDHQRTAWREISEEMKIPVDDLKKRWKVLRDTFAKELKKAIQQSAQASDTELYSKWPHFKRLLFLQKTIRSCKDSVADVCEVSVENSQDEEASNNTDPQSPHSENKFKSALKRRRDSTEERKLSRIEESFPTNDHDAQFLMSLWPFLKDVPKHRKLMVRTKLQQVLIDEQNEVAPAVKVEYSSDY
ncbi:uncharacterized protein LOC133524846 [Cydia pomonella]|uniref:uncharacterized protein LOC133524846 n=1 Tax=Cydia pomonella TaxID=82600 RepID=UPI002ADDCFDC|nr:uncharacterized protein LOC133524846 [Cydia pomonella]